MAALPIAATAVDRAAQGALAAHTATHGSALATAGDALASAGSWIADGVVRVVTWLKDAALVSWAWVSQVAAPAVASACSTAWAWIAHVAAPTVAHAALTAWHWVAHVAAPAVTQAVAQAWHWIAHVATPAVAGALSTAWQAMLPTLQAIGAVLVAIGKGIWDFMVTLGKALFNFVLGTLKTVWDMACGIFNVVKTLFVTIWDKLVELLGPTFSVIGQALVDAGKFMLNFITSHPWMFVGGLAIAAGLGVAIFFIVRACMA